MSWFFPWVFPDYFMILPALEGSFYTINLRMADLKSSCTPEIQIFCLIKKIQREMTLSMCSFPAGHWEYLVPWRNTTRNDKLKMVNFNLII